MNSQEQLIHLECSVRIRTFAVTLSHTHLMEIREIRAMRGPNYWSVRRHKLIVMTLDLQELEDSPTNKIEGFYDRLTAMFPGMYEHRCSVGEPGGFP